MFEQRPRQGLLIEDYSNAPSGIAGSLPEILKASPTGNLSEGSSVRALAAILGSH